MSSSDWAEKLDAMQAKAMQHAFDEMNASDVIGIADAGQRGDRYFLTKMSGTSLGVALRIEQLKALLERRGSFWGQDNEEEEKRKAAERMTAKAGKEVEAILRRINSRVD